MCLSGDAYDGPSARDLAVTRLRAELMDIPKLSDLVTRALQPVGEPWHSDGLSSGSLRQALDSEGDVRTAIVEAVVRSAIGDRAGSALPAQFSGPRALERLRLGGLWQRATELGLEPEAISNALDAANPPRERLTQLADLIRTTEATQAGIAVEKARASAARRATAHELVWGDSEDEVEDDFELWFPRAAIVGPAELRHSVRIAHLNDERVSALDEMQRTRAGQNGIVVLVDRRENRVKVQFTHDGGYGAYWRIMGRVAVHENHDTNSPVVGYHKPGAFAMKLRNNPNLASQEDPGFVRTAPGDERHLSRQDGYVVVLQEHIDVDDTLWVLTKTAPPGASRGGWMQTRTKDAPCQAACCGSRPQRGVKGQLLEMVDTNRSIYAIKIDECEEPDVNGTYRRKHEAACREHFVNDLGMHLYYMPIRKEWHIGTGYFGDQYDNIVIEGHETERFQLSGRHRWCRGRSGENQDATVGGAEGEGDHMSEREGELVVKVMSTPQYQC